ncbi:type IV conjugative transfer system protein TraL [Persephonella sp.]
MEQHYLPRYLNALPQLLWWELDEVMFLAGFTFLGIMADAQLIGAGVGFLSTKFYASFKRKKQPGFLKHWFYSKGLYGLKGKYPDYWIKELMM